MKLTVVVPCYHESAAVHEANREIHAALLAALPPDGLEVIYVDDGSRDDTFEQLEQVAEQFPDTVRVLKLGGNVGSHMAIRAGLENATGTHACFLAADLQEPPSLLPRMIELCKEPVQIVWAVRDSREDPWTTKVFAAGFYRLARLFATKELPLGGASMFLLGPKALHAVHHYSERNLTLEGLFATMGYPMAMLPYQRKERRHGKSKWTLSKKLKLFADFFTAFSYTPIRLISYLGIGIASAGFIYALFLIIARLLLGDAMTTGFAAIMVVVLLLGGFQMIMMGILGEYIWRTLDEVRHRPRYLIDRRVNDPSLRSSDEPF